MKRHWFEVQVEPDGTLDIKKGISFLPDAHTDHDVINLVKGRVSVRAVDELDAWRFVQAYKEEGHELYLADGSKPHYWRKKERRREEMKKTPGMKIQKGVPLPPKRGEGNITIYPFEGMEVGDSFFVAGDRFSKEIRNARAVSSNRSLRTNRKYTARLVTEDGVAGLRVWRIE